MTAIPDGATLSTLFGASCPSASLCVVSGSNSAIASSTDPTGGSEAWSVVHPEGYFISSSGGGLYEGNQIRGVSCPTTTFCAAAGQGGHLLISTAPSLGAWSVVEAGREAAHMRGISCPTAALCVAVALGGKIVSSADPSDESPSAWSIAQLEAPLELTGVSCESVIFCVAVSEGGDILSSTDPTGGAGAWKRVSSPSFGSLFGLACPSRSLCVTGNTEDILTSTQPTGEAGAWSESSAVTPSPLQLTAFSCATSADCAAVDNNSDVLTSTDPTGGAGAWSFTNVIPAPLTAKGGPNGMFAISCPSTSLCLAAGANDQVIFSTAPFSSAPATAGPPANRHAKVPRARITAHPPRRRATPRRWVRVRFRFHALGEARGMQCRLGHQRFHPCRSPKSYRVRAGRHAFMVRAVGPSGVKGPAATFRFRVKHVGNRVRHAKRG